MKRINNIHPPFTSIIYLCSVQLLFLLCIFLAPQKILAQGQKDYRPKIFSEERTITGTTHVVIECWNGVIVGFDCNESKSACGQESKALPSAAERACQSVAPIPPPNKRQQ